ncbi:hypothetical protein FRB93_013131 [Tulasnella sp. JGI-2019a]|nr:hypothetical protein FRB93_013131 [Tulasnella sp. JGI-2019a]
MAAVTKAPSAKSLELKQQATHHLAWQQSPRHHQPSPWSSSSRPLTDWHGSGMAAVTKAPSAKSLELKQQATHRLAWQQSPRHHQPSPWSSSSRPLTDWHGSSHQGTISWITGALVKGLTHW